MIVDTIFDQYMRPVFSNEPENVRRRLRAPYPETWEKICIGATNQIVTIPEYLYAEKFNMVVKELQELLTKKDLAMYKRDPKRLETHVQRVATKLIQRIQDDK